MKTPNNVGADQHAVERQLERELNEVRGAITLVATGRAKSVSITGLRFGESVIDRLRATATEGGVVLEPRWWPADVGCDIVIKPEVAPG